jgi:hypothetical protein
MKPKTRPQLSKGNYKYILNKDVRSVFHIFRKQNLISRIGKMELENEYATYLQFSEAKSRFVFFFHKIFYVWFGTGNVKFTGKHW